jgi:hypothetical protein
MGRNFWDPDKGLYGLFDAWTFRGLEGIVSSGLGGGSLIYANVLLRKDQNWFVQESPVPGGGYESWPFSRQDLDPYYAAAEAMLRPVPYPYRDTPKTLAMETAAGALGLSITRPPIAVTFSPSPGAAAASALRKRPRRQRRAHHLHPVRGVRHRLQRRREEHTGPQLPVRGENSRGGHPDLPRRARHPSPSRRRL